MNNDNYFSHNITAHADLKHETLINRFGFEAYGLYWYMLEKMGKEPEYKMKVTPILITNIAGKMKVKEAHVREIIDYMVSPCQLFKKKAGVIYSESFLERMKIKDVIIQKRIDAGIKSGESRRLRAGTHVEHVLNKIEQTGTNKIKLNEMKLNNKEEKNKKNGSANAHLFKDSPYNDFKVFEAAVKKTKSHYILKGKEISIGFYYNKLKNYSNSKKETFLQEDWIEVFKFFVMNDYQLKKVVYK